VIGAHGWEQVITPSILLASGTLLLLGLWTPIAGALVVIAELWTAVSTESAVRSCVLLAAMGAVLAMLGPGVRSIDARIFGRKRIDIGDR
jgi:putative oxidoreductase